MKKLRRSSSASGEKGLGGVLAGMTGVITGITVGSSPSGNDPLLSLHNYIVGTGNPRKRRKSLPDQGSKS